MSLCWTSPCCNSEWAKILRQLIIVFIYSHYMNIRIILEILTILSSIDTIKYNISHLSPDLVETYFQQRFGAKNDNELFYELSKILDVNFIIGNNTSAELHFIAFEPINLFNRYIVIDGKHKTIESYENIKEMFYPPNVKYKIFIKDLDEEDIEKQAIEMKVNIYQNTKNMKKKTKKKVDTLYEEMCFKRHKNIL